MRSRWLTQRAIGFHCLLVVVVGGCLLAARWQLHAALGGNTLSWAYTVEWPIFSVIAVVAWWQLVHEDPEKRAERAARAAESHRRTAEPPSDDRSTWSEAAIDAYEWDDVSATDAERVAVAARSEYLAHLERIAERERGTIRPTGR